VRGEKAGKPLTSVVKVSHPDGYELTAIPVAACLLQYLAERKPRPGVWMMGEYCDPVRLFKDMETMGVQITGETR
jgi:saccharopine dehydrogenase (NAD+, L-lysine-forming)